MGNYLETSHQDCDIQFVKGVGPKLGQLLKKKNIHTALDFIFTFPRTYDDRRQLPFIADLDVGQTQTFLGIVQSIQEQKTRSKVSLIKARLADKSGSIVCIWFNQPYLKRFLRAGLPLIVKAKIEKTPFEIYKSGHVIEHEKAHDFKPRIEPVYSLSPGLFQSTMRKIAHEVLQLLTAVHDPMPIDIQKKYGLVPINQALKEMHQPSGSKAYQLAKHRLVFDEFFYFQLSLSLNRKHVKQPNIAPLSVAGSILSGYLGNLPYALTDDQRKAIEDIKRDVTGKYRMNRLLQGDVGSGKTDVAIVSLLLAVEAGKKAAVLAPTDILAEQHYLKISKRLAGLEIPVFLLRGKTGKRERKIIHEALSGNDPVVLIGTHAIIEEHVTITDLGMVIIDEQHRFGVLQRAALMEKGKGSHCLFMTATPIPRSLLLSCFGDLETSVIKQMPPGRIPPKTFFFKENKLENVYEFCEKHVLAGHQLYVVYPLVEESEKLDLKSATEGAENLKRRFPNVNVGLLHGKMKQKEKSDIMAAFKNNDIQILVSTTVIEVGIDVPNSTMMIIRHAERFGLSQLHQLRGRIGRGGHASFCFLVADPKSEHANDRIKAMLDTTDGFQLAEVDLKIRGPGDILGTRQSGLPEFKVASLSQDEVILNQAKSAVHEMVANDPELMQPHHVGLKQAMAKKYHISFSRIS